MAGIAGVVAVVGNGSLLQLLGRVEPRGLTP